jgi:hypothetical protein
MGGRCEAGPAFAVSLNTWDQTFLMAVLTWLLAIGRRRNTFC